MRRSFHFLPIIFFLFGLCPPLCGRGSAPLTLGFLTSLLSSSPLPSLVSKTTNYDPAPFPVVALLHLFPVHPEKDSPFIFCHHDKFLRPPLPAPFPPKSAQAGPPFPSKAEGPRMAGQNSPETLLVQPPPQPQSACSPFPHLSPFPLGPFPHPLPGSRKRQFTFGPEAFFPAPIVLPRFLPPSLLLGTTRHTLPISSFGQGFFFLPVWKVSTIWIFLFWPWTP